jgi:pilus assembly protein Flp/PilA
MVEPLRFFLKDEPGATAIEYALIAASIAGAIAATVTGLGSQVRNTFSGISQAMEPPATTSAASGAASTSASAGTEASSDAPEHAEHRRHMHWQPWRHDRD